MLIYKRKIDKNHNIDFHYFEIDNSRIKKVPILKDLISTNDKKVYTSYEIDDLLLNPFEDLGLYEDQGMIPLELIYEDFAYYLLKVHENKQIEKYINTIRNSDEENWDLFEKFDKVCEKVKSYGLTKKHEYIAPNEPAASMRGK